jgi:hypothetical protein
MAAEAPVIGVPPVIDTFVLLLEKGLGVDDLETGLDFGFGL